eukprot:gb/GFBE01010128.1/.p1 GENE.gb/GFBE01010128.1/~~gb/GFBE01010128.1/.p1  ORF type:complete len:380 (+),score=67.40 gb/GFBE01010128.1/:1-1140(+)
MDVNAGLAIGDARGFYGSKPHLLSHSPRVWTFFGPCLVPDLTVCGSFISVLPHLLALLYALAIMVILCFTAFPDGEMGTRKACAVGNVKICQLEATMKEAKAEFRFLIAFVLAGYVAGTLSSWGARRTSYAALCGGVRNLVVQVATFVPNEKVNAEMTSQRTTLGRWIILAYELAVLKARSSMDSDEGYKFLLQEKLVCEQEWEAMVPGDRHTTVVTWIQQRLVTLHQQGAIPIEYVRKVTEDITSFRGLANDIMGCLNTDRPYAYASLVGLLVNINLLIMSTWKGVEWSTWYNSFGPEVFEQPKWWLDVLVLVVWNMSYRALYDLATILHNPFGPRRLDVPHETVSVGLRKFMEQMMAGANVAPQVEASSAPILESRL